MVLSMLGVHCRADARDEQVLSWVASQSLPAGKSYALQLPANLRDASADASVHVARLSDGRTCILLKKSIGYKENFKGVVRCSAPLRAAEVIPASAQSRSYIALPGQGVFEELYVEKQRDPQRFDVFFDLH